ncbi:hypothetical protein [Natrinema marinum]|uniref:hypothetical protein n=1 Tax=Natrinema marinum TaxID=2961598 RepID=UPI0020C92AB6|nr:hypothetical protein [Natrinema marinum]
MPLTSTTDTRQRTTRLVTTRIPNRATGDLETEAERRLARIDGVVAATVDELRGLEPALSATTVTVAVTLETSDETAEANLRERLLDAPCVEDVTAVS